MQFSVRTLVAVLATAGILAGCSSVPVDGAKTAGTTTTAASTSGSQNGQGVTVDNSAVKTVEVDPLNDPKSRLLSAPFTSPWIPTRLLRSTTRCCPLTQTI